MIGLDYLRTQRDEILAIAARHGVTEIRIFGSTARGDADPSSDVDILVAVGPNRGPWFPGTLLLSLRRCWASQSRSLL
ncbi:MAG: nucleotidyltransferase family protein [Acidobacteriota bacterium]